LTTTDKPIISALITRLGLDRVGPLVSNRLGSRYRYMPDYQAVAKNRTMLLVPLVGRPRRRGARDPVMGGDITVASEPGKGSVFTVRLPGGPPS
jgi:hypothetical protein